MATMSEEKTEQQYTYHAFVMVQSIAEVQHEGKVTAIKRFNSQNLSNSN